MIGDNGDTISWISCPVCLNKTITDMKEKIKSLLEDVLPLVDLDSDFLFAELDSLGVTTIMMVLSSEYGIQIDAVDATPKNLKNLDSIVAMVQKKLESK